MRMIRTFSILLCILIGMIFAIGFGPMAGGVDAKQSVINAWLAEYPDSASFTNGNCQLCHLNQGGGDGWNAYGWSIRQGIHDQNLSETAAILAVALADADGNNIPNVSEINGSAQPGWKAGAVNSIYFEDGSVLSNQPPPTNGVGTLDAGTATLPNPTATSKTYLPYVARQ